MSNLENKSSGMKVSFHEKLFFGGGNLGNCLILIMTTSYLMYFFTDAES